MATEIGEYVVGAYLKLVEGCEIIDYNVRPPYTGLKGLDELDVVALNFEKETVYLCEVTTHIRGLLYGNNKKTIDRVKKKFKVQREFFYKFLHDFKNFKFMFWSPVVPNGYLTKILQKIDGLEVIINSKYRARVCELQKLASINKQNTVNPFFRSLQILKHMRD